VSRFVYWFPDQGGKESDHNLAYPAAFGPAVTAEGVAESVAEWNNQGDFADRQTVAVKDTTTGEVAMYEVVAEQTVIYRATRKEGER